MKTKKYVNMNKNKKDNYFATFEDGLIIEDSMVSEHVCKHSKIWDRLNPYRMSAMVLNSFAIMSNMTKSEIDEDLKDNWIYRFR